MEANNLLIMFMFLLLLTSARMDQNINSYVVIAVIDTDSYIKCMIL